ncbi:PD-(D/E)XK motif protein [Marinobacter nauticus]|uniref:PD-(D/E)XK motif protein n=1 Tax=Marinobacter nauticus TaxID=2743 RepID=UPI001C5831F9|nr:PD-(D/E)XK motif protein [Marinobacter nauticus]MBW3196768.1 PD-(D/E)XK motif protein [Marinobacter nauticus]MBY6182178.1 PD-(D/E)XK motif protein [Marinobacter nauticus]
MSDAEQNASNQWAMLRHGDYNPSGDELPTRKCHVELTSGHIRFALGASGEARFLLPLGRSEKAGKFPVSAALQIREISADIEGDRCRFLDMTCTVFELESVFAEVVDEIIQRIEGGANGPLAVRSTLRDFRSLLLQPKGKEVSVEEVIGLVGELLVLNELLDLSSHAWKAWMGPRGGRHDFRAGGIALEVKSTRSLTNNIVSAQSLEQFREPTNGNLYLVRLTLEITPGGVLSVSSLFNRAVQRCDRPDKLLECLKELKCQDPEAPEWNTMSFSLENEVLFRVDDAFPRLTVSNFHGGELPLGVQGVKYDIDLSQASGSIIPGTEKVAIQNELIKCLAQV